MTRPESYHLLGMLAKVPDPRKKKGCRHPLQAMLGVLVVGLLCGHKGYTCIATWLRTQPGLAKVLGFRHKKTPAAATFHNLLKVLDVVKLEQTLTQWVMATFENTPALETHSRLTGVAIDGKSLRGTHLVESHRIHLLAAVSHELGIPLAECAVGEKTNEIPVSTQLLKHFDVAGKVITTDALLTQRAFCKELLAADADYALPVKANQKQMLEDIRDLFKPLSEIDPPEVDARRFENLHTQAGAPLDTHTDVETAHGFITTRTLRSSTLLTPDSDWPGLAQVYEYRGVRVSISHNRIVLLSSPLASNTVLLSGENTNARLLPLARSLPFGERVNPSCMSFQGEQQFSSIHIPEPNWINFVSV